MVGVTIKSEDVANLVRAISAHTDAKVLRRELYRGLNSASKGVRGEMKEVIPAALPARGGLAALIHGATSSTTTAKAGRFAGVSIRFRAKGHDIRILTGRRLRHPVYGNRRNWVNQTAGLEPAVFIGEFEQQTPEVRRAIERVLEDVARKVTNI